MTRRSPLLVLLAVALIAPASADAGDPLLSGYAGPGAGEQVVLGGGSVGGGKGGGGGTSGTVAVAQRSLRATTAPAQGATSSASAQAPRTTPTPATRRPSSSGAGERRRRSSAATQPKTSLAPIPTATASLLAATPPVVAYPTTAGDVGDLPLSLPGALLVLLGLGACALATLGLRRWSPSPPDLRPTPQVSLR